ncbi:hypothetical protein QN277_000611 [Acacia crassicarpa]|uniref:Secreted protein n=1 Tax=Acacia crassicarpa TaxID=499986 RepID=A0AAE1TG70_9FABA|nr:hypothetical protein QN277_000611 [Acacia crassicarpa]
MDWFGGACSLCFLHLRSLSACEIYRGGIADYQSSITIFSWRPISENPDFSSLSKSCRRLWGSVKRPESFHPANPGGHYVG